MSKQLRVLAILAFVIADVVLVLAALRYVDSEPPAVDLPDSATTAEPEPTPDSPQDPYDFAVAASFEVGVGDDQTVLRARRGSCATGEAAQVAVSTDAGRTFVPTDTGLVEVMAVRAVNRSQLRLVGASADCSVERLVSDDGGSTWDTDDADDVWFTSPANPEEVVSPDGPSRPGCVVTSLSQVGSSFGRVSCADGSVRGTGNGGAEWVELGRLDNVRVMEFTSFNAGQALAVFQGCAAQAFSTRDGGRTWAEGGCITGDPAQAVAANDTTLFASVGDQPYVSSDGGASWRQP